MQKKKRNKVQRANKRNRRSQPLKEKCYNSFLKDLLELGAQFHVGQSKDCKLPEDTYLVS